MNSLLASMMALIAAAVPLGASAAPGPRPATAITFEPLGPIYARAFPFEVERKVSPGWSLALQPTLLFASHRVKGEDGALRREDALIGSLTVGARVFLGGDGLTGFFAGPLVTLALGGFNDDRGALPASIAAGGLAGYNHLLGRVFMLSTGVGAQYHARLDEGRAGRALPLLRLAIGAAF